MRVIGHLLFSALVLGLVAPIAACRPSAATGSKGPGEEPSAASAAAAPNTPPKIRVRKGDLAFLDVEDAPGHLIDTNAPPPPADQPPPKHPFVTASCYGGDPALCARAREILLASQSYGDFVARLRAAGFVVEARR